MELLQELRVAIPGIQFLFAFLLVVPFQQGWVEVTDFEKRVYYVTLLLTATSSVCLIAPTARHRIRFRELDKQWIVETSNRLAIAGPRFLAPGDLRRDPARLPRRLRQRLTAIVVTRLSPSSSPGSGSSPRSCASCATRTERRARAARRSPGAGWPSRSRQRLELLVVGAHRRQLLGAPLLPDDEAPSRAR